MPRGSDVRKSSKAYSRPCAARKGMYSSCLPWTSASATPARYVLMAWAKPAKLSMSLTR